MTKTFIRKGVFTFSINILILLIGVFTHPYLANEFIPSVEIPAVVVVIPTPLMPFEDVSKNVVSPIEKAFLHSGEIDNVEARIEKNRAIIIVFYKWKYGPEEALRKARTTVENLDRAEGTMDPVFVLHRPSNNPIFRFVLYDQSIKALSKSGAQIKSLMERISGVSEVKLIGDVPNKSIVEVSPKKLMEYKINSNEIVQSAKRYWNLNILTENNGIANRLHLKVTDQNDTKLLPVFSKHRKEPVPLGMISNIYEANEKSKVTFNNGKEAVIIEVIKSPGSDTLSIVDQAKNILEQDRPEGVLSQVIYNEAEKIRESQYSVFQNFFIGVVLNSIILMMFLGSPIGVLVASVVFPTSLLGTLFMMKQFGISINLFSLNGFSLAVGMITDASTVVLESITRRFQKGQELFSACIQGVLDVRMGVIASTLTTAGVLLPIAFQKNVSSKLFSDLSLTVVSTQMLCLIAVFTLVPWMCFNLLKRDEAMNPIISFLFSLSGKIVNSLVDLAHYIQHKCRTSLSQLLLYPGFSFGLSLITILFLPQTEFLPLVSSRVYSLKYPIKSSELSRSVSSTRDQLAEVVSSNENTNWVVSQSTENGVSLLFETRKVLPLQQVKGIFKHLDLIQKRINIFPLGPAPVGEEMGYDGLVFVETNEKSDQFIHEFCNHPYVSDCLSRPFYQQASRDLKINHLAAFRMGSNGLESTSQVFLPLNPINLSELADFELTRPMELKIPTPSDILDLPVQILGNQYNKLSTVFESELHSRTTLANHLNNYPFAPLFFKIKDATLGQVQSVYLSIMDKVGLNEDQVVGRSGLATMDESFTSMFKALAISAFIVFTILVIQFKSVVQASIIMATIPLTLGGAVLGLIFMNETVNASVMVGFILLVGIVVNNGIFLVEATNQHLANLLPKAEAIKMAVQDRTRPILMTSFSTIFGMLPTLLIGGEGSELYRGMAIVNIFGMITGTILSVVITPIIIEFFIKIPTEGKTA
jgi:HAE1 family hydrophobic/amphiphilic exporter-1